MNNLRTKLNFFARSQLVRQVIFMSFLWSFGVLAVVSIYTSYSYYVDGQKSIVNEMNYLEKVIDTPLENALWGVDEESIKTILNVLSQNPNVARARIENSDGSLMESSSVLKMDWITLSFPMHHKKTLGSKKLGTLYLSLSKNNFYKNLKENIISSCLRNFARFGLLFMCIVFIFNKKVLGPLMEIQQMSKQFNDEHLTPILGGNLSRPRLEYKNEIEALHKEIQVLQENFMLAFFMQQKAKEINHDIELQLEKEKQKLLLSQRLDTIGQITAQVAHDFGNLIMIINGKTKSLDNRLTDPDDLKQTEAIRKATSRAHALIKKILSMTRSQKNELVMLDPFENLIEIQDLLKISIGRDITLNIESDSSSKMIYVEPSSYENVIINLCVNARDAMPEGGAIQISLKTRYKDEQEFVAISIQDNGGGIPEEIQARIFDPFFTTKAPGKGTGLGLSQVQDFVKGVGGSLELTSKKDGTCFTLLLPNKAIGIMDSAA